MISTKVRTGISTLNSIHYSYSPKQQIQYTWNNTKGFALTQEDSDLIIILASIHHSSLLECFDNWKELCYSIYDHLLHLLQMLLDKDTWIEILVDLIITPSFNHYSQIELNDNHWMNNFLQTLNPVKVDLTIISSSIITLKSNQTAISEWITSEIDGIKWK